jgi:aspartokinase/homoserine dehydrogenase 1
VSKALNTLHEAFFLSDRRIVHVFLVGTGLIGGALLQMIRDQYEALAQHHHLEVQVVAIANSTRMWFDEGGLTLTDATSQLKTVGEPMHLPSFLQRMRAMNLPNSIFVDCTSAQEVADQYEGILNENISIVTPNKKANSGKYEQYRALKQAAFRRGVRFYYETNVGAGLPVISTLNDLMLSGDRVIRIEAVLSGTMNYIFSSFEAGMSFSSIVRAAKEKGYTEPDPRDDLNGKDVARKILILAREAGLPLEFDQVTVKSVVPPDCEQVEGVADFLDALQKHDAGFEQLRAEAETKNQRLRYMAVLHHGAAAVALTTVGADHPFYSLKGSDNIILLTTERYRDRPMVIRGPGAGAEVTAAGVFADIIRIGNYVQR